MSLRRNGSAPHSPTPAHSPSPPPTTAHPKSRDDTRAPRRRPRPRHRRAESGGRVPGGRLRMILRGSAIALLLGVLPAAMLSTSATAVPAAVPAAALGAAPAAPNVSFGHPSPGLRVLPGHLGHLRFASSSNWAGYAAVSTTPITPTTYTGVTASWTEPGASCGSGTAYAAFWVGLDGYSSDSVEQTGTMIECYRGKAYQYVWYEMYPANPVYFSNPVKAGDSISASVTATASGAFTLKLADATQRWTQTVNKTNATLARSSAEVIAEAPSSGTGVLPLANFGSVSFMGATVSGGTLAASTPTPITMVTSSGQTKSAPSAIGSGGESFSCSWQHS